eukprot:5112808-Pyramimonas_sp.AAC.1
MGTHQALIKFDQTGFPCIKHSPTFQSVFMLSARHSPAHECENQTPTHNRRNSLRVLNTTVYSVMIAVLRGYGVLSLNISHTLLQLTGTVNSSRTVRRYCDWREPDASGAGLGFTGVCRGQL